MKSVYVHIPFCSSICTYCDFCKLYYDKTLIKTYLKALELEITNIYNGEPIRTIYIGGGTPSVLDMEDLKHLFEILKIFSCQNLEEYTIECNVEDIEEEKLKLFKNNGINRLSIGVQTFNPKFLKILGRNYTYESVSNAIEIAKEVEFTNISIDLIYGINGQTIDDLKTDLTKLLKLDIPHVSLYSLIIEPHTKLYINNFKDLDEDLNASMYEWINKILMDNGYNHYEISNYAKEGYESKHNLVYWHNEEYYGFGLSASSFIQNKRIDNTRSLNHYLEGSYKLNELELTKREMMENEMILGLRLTSGVNKNHFYSLYGKKIEDVFDLQNLLENKLLIDDGINIYIPSDKFFISNSILIEFID
ncbi:MAG: radical SAM family heme chaperone HemW [Bacilli bacterium]|nr:radical SAM family heme chaperone HemW [Bacilli bacterium]MDD4053777.1 radical SAM family heme chaperone HemW [Bacilli bacterium]MDD4411649.1 radical SAM family heme chaperone HemW [Bacilli bacterium]